MNNKRLCYGKYIKTIERIKFFDLEQTTMRLRTSQILLGNFLAVGFIFSSHTAINYNRFLITAGVSFACLIMITWFAAQDLIITERLLISNFATAFNLEKKHHWLPPTHHFMLENEEHHGAPTRKVVFYLGAALCLTVIITGCLWYLLFFKNILWKALLWIGMSIIFSVYAITLIKMTGNFSKLLKKAIEVTQKEANDI